MVLNYRDRPEAVVKRINLAFKKISSSEEAYFFYGGESYYKCLTNESAIVKHIIQSHPQKKDFYVLDIGAGNYKFSIELAKRINEEVENNNIAQDIKLHIVGINGEDTHDTEISDTGICKLYNFGNIKVENLHDELIRKGLDVEFDFAVSSWTLRHLVDSLGTFIQAHEMLSADSNTGYFLFDGFPLAFEGDEKEWWQQSDSAKEYTYSENTVSMLSQLNDPFFICHYGSSLNDFVLKKTHDANLPFTYNDQLVFPTHNPTYGKLGIPEFAIIESEWVNSRYTNFNDIFYANPLRDHKNGIVVGDEELFTLFKDNNLFQEVTDTLVYCRSLDHAFAIKNEELKAHLLDTTTTTDESSPIIGCPSDTENYEQ